MRVKPTKAFLITPDDLVTEITPKNGKTFKLEEAQSLVEGYIELVGLGKKQIMILNENCKFDKSPNLIATAIAHLHKAIMSFDYICGNVVICPSKMLP